VYGTSKSDPEYPTPESAKIAESLVLLEFVADMYPDSGLLPQDLVERARVRSFIDVVSNKLFASYIAFFLCGEALDDFIAAIAEVQELLSSSGFAAGDHFTIADAALAPFVGRWELPLRNDFGNFEEGTGPQVHAVLFQSERFSRLQNFLANISSRQSFKNTFDLVRLLLRWIRRCDADYVWVTRIPARKSKGEVVLLKPMKEIYRSL
jgi:glutathione S-transferase